MAKSFEEKLNSELEGERPEAMKDENLGLFKEFIDTVDMIDLENSQAPLVNDSPFIIEPVPVEVAVKSGKIGEEYDTLKKATRLKIVLSPNFSFNNVPELVKEIQEKHNEAAEVTDAWDDNVYFTDIARTIAREYLFWAKQLYDFRDLVPETARSHYDQYTNQLVEIAKTYQPDIAEDLDVSANLDLASLNADQLQNLSLWTKTVEGKEALARWWAFRDRMVKEHGVSPNPEKMERLMELVDSLVVIPNIKKSFAKNIEQAIMARGEKEMWYLSDIPEAFVNEFHSAGAEAAFKKFFPDKWQGIERLRQGLLDAKEEGNAEKTEELQTLIFTQVCKVVYCEKYWKYKLGAYKISQVHQKEVNCMAQGAIIHAVMKEMIGEETLGGGRNGHFFPVLKTVTGKLVIPFDYSNIRTIEFSESSKPVELKDQELVRVNKGCPWIAVGEHSVQYRAAVWDWIGIKHESEFAGERAISLGLIDPMYYSNLALLLDKKPESRKRAEAMYLKAVELAPYDPELNYYCFVFYESEKDYKKALFYCRESLGLLKKNTGTTIKAKIETREPITRENMIIFLESKVSQLERQAEKQRQAEVGGNVDPHEIF